MNLAHHLNPYPVTEESTIEALAIMGIGGVLVERNLASSAKSQVTTQIPLNSLKRTSTRLFERLLPRFLRLGSRDHS